MAPQRCSGAERVFGTIDLFLERRTLINYIVIDQLLLNDKG